ncbi:MAG: hypothetical protein GXP62_12495, partial [Oligoflexia bacterium]|nr:hypothetical protein [Oligoflexia bacterium]
MLIPPSRLLVAAALAVGLCGTAHAGCPSTGATLLTIAAQATQDFQARDAEAVASSVAQIRRDLLCASTVLDPAQVAAVHRAYALQSFLTGKSDQTRIAYFAARTADPDYQLPADLVPAGHALRKAFDEAGNAPAPSLQPLAQRANQRMWVDGRQAQQRPTDRPVLLQADLTSGVIVGSVYLLPGDDLPGWAVPNGANGQAVASVAAPVAKPAAEPVVAPAALPDAASPDAA